MPFLKTDHICLRALEPEDLERLYRWENDESLWIAGNTRSPYSKFQLKAYIANAQHDIYTDGTLRLMIDELPTGETVGTVDLFDLDIHHSRVALGLFVAPEFRGKGFAAATLKLVEEYVFNFLKINQLYVQIAEQNKESRRLFENNYEQHALLKNWLKTPDGMDNVLVFQKFRK